MKNRIAVITALLTLAIPLVLSGCYESTGITLYEPGVYKGKTDPLLEKLRGDKLPAELEQRFKTGQTDR